MFDATQLSVDEQAWCKKRQVTNVCVYTLSNLWFSITSIDKWNGVHFILFFVHLQDWKTQLRNHFFNGMLQETTCSTITFVRSIFRYGTVDIQDVIFLLWWWWKNYLRTICRRSLHLRKRVKPTGFTSENGEAVVKPMVKPRWSLGPGGKIFNEWNRVRVLYVRPAEEFALHLVRGFCAVHPFMNPMATGEFQVSGFMDYAVIEEKIYWELSLHLIRAFIAGHTVSWEASTR